MAIVDRDLGLESYTPPEVRTTAEVTQTTEVSPQQQQVSSSEMRSVLFNDVVHVFEVTTIPRSGMEDRTAVTSVRTLNKTCGRETGSWVVIGSRDTKEQPHIRADFQPEGAVGRTKMHTVHIFEDEESPILITEPHEMPKSTTEVVLSPKTVKRLSRIGKCTGHASIKGQLA